MAFIFLINILISFPLSLVLVQRNRGQLLDRPEWRVIPELTICLFFFIFFLSGSWLFSQDTGKPEMITVAVVIFVVIFVAVLVVICKSELFNKIVTKKLSLTGKGDGNPDSQSNSLKEKKEYYKERLSYISYTVIYFSVIFLFLALLEVLVLGILLSDHSKEIYKLFGLKEKEDIFESELQKIHYISIVGIGFTIFQMLESFKFSKEKMQKDRIANIKEYLAEKSVKN